MSEWQQIGITFNTNTGDHLVYVDGRLANRVRMLHPVRFTMDEDGFRLKVGVKISFEEENDGTSG